MITQHQIELMQHALGINERNRNSSRNFFLASSGHDDNPEWQELVSQGYAELSPAPSWVCGDIIYRCTTRGKIVADIALPWPKRPSRAKRRYQDYREVCECYENFASFLGFDNPEYEYEYSWECHHRVRLKSSRVAGKFCSTKKAAKASYKVALMELIEVMDA